MKRVTLPLKTNPSVILNNDLTMFTRVILATFTLIFLIADLNAATRTSTTAGGTWSAGTTWVGGVAPSTTDIAIIATTGSNQVTLGGTTTIASITVNPGARLNVNSRSFTINGSVNNQGTITVTTGRILQASNADITNGGTITYTGAGRLQMRGSFFNTGTISLASALVIITGNNPAASTVDGLSTTGTVTYSRTAGSVTMNGNLSGSTLTINATGGTFNLGVSRTHTFTGAVTLTNGTLQGGSSTLNANLVGTAWANNGGTFTAQTGTINFGGAGNQTIGGTKTTVFNNLHLSGSGTKTLPSYALTVNNLFQLSGTASTALANTVSAAEVIVNTGTTLSMTTRTLNVSGSVNNEGTINLTTGTINQTGAGNFTNSGTITFTGAGAINVAGNFTNNGTLTPGTGTISLNGTSAQVIGGTTNPVSFYNLTVGNAAGVTLAASHEVNVTNNLQINSGAFLEIGTERLVDANRIVNNAGTAGLILRAGSSEANGSLIFDNIESETVEGTVEMYTKAYYDAAGPTGYKYKWQYFGIPLRSLSSPNPTFYGSYLRKYNEAGTGSSYWTTVTNTTAMSPFDGYQITQVDPKTVMFTGILENRPFSRDLSYTSGSVYPGQHVLSNPYTAAIDIHEIQFDTDMDSTVYLFNTGSKTDWDTQTGTDWSAGQYITVPQNLAGMGGLPGRIPSLQGFIVKTKTSPTYTNITIPYDAVTIKKNDGRLRSKSVSEEVYSIITVSGNRYLDKMWLFAQPGCTTGFDNGWDGKKIMGSTLKPQVYAIGTDGNYQVNTVADINNTTLGFRAGEDSLYTITFEHNNIESAYEKLHLTDMLTDSVVDITESGSQYTFSTVGSTEGARFTITAEKVVIDTDDDSDDDTNNNVLEPDFKVYYADGNLIVNNPTINTGILYLFDLKNHRISNFSFAGESLSSYPINLPRGIYLIKAQAGRLKYNKAFIVR